MKTLQKYLLYILSLSLLVNFISISDLITKGRKISEQKQSIIALNSEVRTYTTKNSELAYQNSVVQMSMDEIKQSNDEILQELDNLKIKLRNVEQFTQLSATTEQTIITSIRDSLVIDTVGLNRMPYLIIDTLKSFNYQDEFTSINSVIYPNDSVKMNLRNIVPLTQALHKGKRLKWWKIWKRRPIVSTIYTKNPNTILEYTRTVELR